GVSPLAADLLTFHFFILQRYFMRKVIILTVAGKPEIEVERHLGREEISRIVSRRYGYQGIHLPHSWLAFE
ncbi:MAG: hypothetical protein KC652_22145, partial [Cyanobacteria bacterium HKST-UBA01]|nr:hypothetical protein [Cyanobacteria bacterium HKST-UBA01]